MKYSMTGKEIGEEGSHGGSKETRLTCNARRRCNGLSFFLVIEQSYIYIYMNATSITSFVNNTKQCLSHQKVHRESDV